MQKPSRIDLLDSLRGFALMGLFLVHCVEMFELYWANPVPGPVFDWTFFLFAGKSFALFALCFGISFHIIMDRAAARGVDFGARFAWRLTILFLIGTAHAFVYRGDILQVLALLGLALIPLHKVRSERLLLGLAILFLIQAPLFVRAWAAASGAAWANHPPLFMGVTGMPALTDGSLADVFAVNLVDGHVGKWSYYIETGRVVEIVGLFILGSLLGRSGFFAEPQRFVKERRIALGAALLAWGALYFAKSPVLDAVAPADAGSMARQCVQWAFDCWIAVSFLAVQVVIFVELYQGLGRPILRLLAPVGRMTLYVGQSLLFVPVFYGFGLDLHDDVTQVQTILIGVLAFALQVAFAHLWFRHFLYGPLEWLWRALTNGTRDVPFVRPATT